MLLICGTLIHETFVIIYIPFLLLILATQPNTNSNNNNGLTIKSLIKPCLVLLPTFIVFIITVLNSGNQETVIKIWNSWQSTPFGLDTLNVHIESSGVPGALGTLSQTLKEGLMNYTYLFFRDKDYAFPSRMYGPFMIVVAVFIVYYILSNINKFDEKILGTKPDNTHDKTLISSVLIIQFCIISVLFVLGYDYGRWIFYWVTYSFTVLLLVPENQIQRAIPSPIRMISCKLNNKIDSILGTSKASIYILAAIISFPMVKWFFPNNMMECSSLYGVLASIGDFFEFIYSLIL